MNLRLNGGAADLTDLSKSVGGGILDHEVLVVHHSDQNWECLLDQILKQLNVRTVKNGTKRRNCSFPFPPVFATDVGLNKWQNVCNDKTANTLGVQPKTLMSGPCGVIFVVRSIFILVGEKLEKDGDNFTSSDAGKVPERTEFLDTLLGKLCSVSIRTSDHHVN